MTDVKITYLNTLILGVILLFGAIFWTYWEIEKSTALLSGVSDPVNSSRAGRDAAVIEFRAGYYHFIDSFDETTGRVVPGISEEELSGQYSEYAPPNFMYCGFGLRHENFALDLDSLRVTNDYALAFNAKLKELIDEN